MNRRWIGFILTLAFLLIGSGPVSALHEPRHSYDGFSTPSEHHPEHAPPAHDHNGHDHKTCAFCVQLQTPFTATPDASFSMVLEPLAEPVVCDISTPFVLRLTFRIACRGPPVA